METQKSTLKSQALFERARQIFPGGVHSPVRGFRGVGGVPRFIESAKGVELRDVDGNGYTDYCMSWGPLIFGHQNEEILEAAARALYRGWSYGTAEPYSLELAELMRSHIPWLEKVRFVSSGTEAVMSALRVARAATGRQKILKFDGCYHGHVDSMLVRAGSGLAEMASPDSAGVSASVASETIVAPLNDFSALEKIFETHGHDIAAIVLEPIPANNGLLLPEETFWPRVCSLARKYGALIFFDEVITGFRVAFGGAAECLGLKPDLVTYGKVLGGGFPLAAYGGKKELMDLVAPQGSVYQAGTLSAQPVAVAVGLAMLKKLLRENPYATLDQQTSDLTKRLRDAARKNGVNDVHVQKFGSIFWIVFGNIKTSDGFVRAIPEIPVVQKEQFPMVFHRLLEKGIYLSPSGFEVCFLSSAHQIHHLDALVMEFAKALEGLA